MSAEIPDGPEQDQGQRPPSRFQAWPATGFPAQAPAATPEPELAPEQLPAPVVPEFGPETAATQEPSDQPDAGPADVREGQTEATEHTEPVAHTDAAPAESDGPAPERPEPEPAPDAVTGGDADTGPGREEAVAELAAQVAQLAGQLEALAGLPAQIAELARLRARDGDIIERLHADNTRLRGGEIAAATAPLLGGLLRLHDQMTSLAAGDTQSIAGMLRTQLLQLLEVAGGVAAYEAAHGDRFDAARHTGAGRATTPDPARDGTVARTLRPGFARADGTVVRVAEVEVYRHTPAAPAAHPAHAGTDQQGARR